MGYKTIFQILLILAIISTICICIMKPKMHNSVMIYNSDYKIVTNQNVKVADKDIPILVQNSNIQNSQNVEVANQDMNLSSNNQNIVVQDVNMNSTQTRLQNAVNRGTSLPVTPINIAPTNVNNVKNITPIKNNITPTSTKVNFNQTKVTPTKVTPTQTKINTTNVKPSNTKVTTQSPQIDLQRIVNNAQKAAQNQQQPVQTQTPKPTTTPKPITTTASTTKTTPPTVKTTTTAQTPKPATSATAQTPKPVSATSGQNITLTAAEEEIAWNRWRSNLQNSIMRDVNMPVVPNGTIFRFTFDVDKYGKVSNVQTWSDTKSYTPYAIQFIAPVIRSYQGHSILNFPTGSRRVTTHFEGAWRTSTSSKYSTPNDYNDIEKVRK